MDFSQFKVRGHYEHSERLKHYFQAMMWCGTIDLRVAGNPHNLPAAKGGASSLSVEMRHFEQALDDVRG